MSVTIKDPYHQYKINLTTNMATPPTLNIYKNSGGSVNRSVNGVATENGYMYIVDSSWYDVGDVLTFRLATSSTTDLEATNEGITVLVNGEVEDTIHTDSYSYIPHDSGDYTFEFVYKGNNASSMATTSPMKYHVTQEIIDTQGEPVSGEYTLEFVDKTTTKFDYSDGSHWTWVLKRGGNPVVGQTINIDLPDGSTESHQTKNPTGRVTVANSGFDVGKYKLCGRFVYDGSTQKNACKSIEIVKATPTIKTNVTNNTISLGDRIRFSVKYGSGEVTGENLTVYINGNKQTKKLNTSGNVWFKPSKTGTYQFKVQYKGNKNLNAVKQTFNIVVS